MLRWYLIDIDKSLKSLRPMLQEYKDHLKALQNGESFTPTLTAKTPKKKRARSSTPGSDIEEMGSPSGKKRKRHDHKEKSAKRRKSNDGSDAMDDDDDFIVDDDDELEFSDDEDGERKSETGSDDDMDSSKESETEGGDEEDDEMEEDVTEDSLKQKIEEAESAIKEGRVQLSEQRRIRKEAMDQLATLKKTQDKQQREKNAFCSLKRSEVRLACTKACSVAHSGHAVLS